MRDTNKGFMAVKVKKDTYDILKAMAIENKCTLAALIHEAVSKLKPDDAGNIYNKVSRIEQSLKDLHSDFEQLQGWLSDFDVKESNGNIIALIPPHHRGHLPYMNDKDIKNLQKANDAYSKMHAQDEADRDAAIARGEDVVERRPRQREGKKLSIALPPDKTPDKQ